MIKDIFKFKKTAWHAKLMTFVWGYEPTDFRNMCPYFWLSVVNVVFILPILVIKAFIKLLQVCGTVLHSVSSSIDRACDSKAALWIDAKMDKVFQDTDYADMVINADTYCLPGSKERKLREVWHSIPHDRRVDLINAYKLRMIERQKNAAKKNEEDQKIRLKNYGLKAKKAESKAARIGKATVIIKKIFNIIKYPLAAGLLYLLYLGVSALITFTVQIDYSWVPRFLYVVYIFVGTILGITMFGIPVVAFISWMSCRLKGMCMPCEIRKERLMSFFRLFIFLKYAVYILYPFIGVWWCMKGIWRGIKTFIELCLAVKKDNCPGLEWKD